MYCDTCIVIRIISSDSMIKLKYSLLQTEEEFLSGLTQDSPDDSVGGHDDDEEEEDDSEDSEEDEEQEHKNSQNVVKRSQSSHVGVDRRADVGAIVNSLMQEGEN